MTGPHETDHELMAEKCFYFGSTHMVHCTNYEKCIWYPLCSRNPSSSCLRFNNGIALLPGWRSLANAENAWNLRYQINIAGKMCGCVDTTTNAHFPIVYFNVTNLLQNSFAFWLNIGAHIFFLFLPIFFVVVVVVVFVPFLFENTFERAYPAHKSHARLTNETWVAFAS